MSDSLWPHRLACQVHLSPIIPQSLLKVMSVESVMPSNHFTLFRPLLLLPSIFPRNRVFSNESVLCIRWPKYWSFSISSVQFSSVAQSCSTLQPLGLQHTRLPCPSPTPGAYSNSCLLSQWCHPTISSSVVPFSSHLQSFPATGSFLVSQFFTSGGQSIGVSASNEYSGLISFRIDWLDLLEIQGTLRAFSNAIFQKHQFFGAQLSLWSTFYIHAWLLEKP